MNFCISSTFSESQYWASIYKIKDKCRTDRMDILIGLGLGLVFVDHSLDGNAQVAKVGEHVFVEELVLSARHDNLPVQK